MPKQEGQLLPSSHPHCLPHLQVQLVKSSLIIHRGAIFSAEPQKFGVLCLYVYKVAKSVIIDLINATQVNSRWCADAADADAADIYNDADEV